MVAAPNSEQELLARAHALAGFTVAELAEKVGREVPESTTQAKGLVGRVVEEVLGATAGPRGKPDFVELGIELKTIPLDAQGRPRESTFVCSISLSVIAEVDWEQSLLWRKLQRVLFVPVEAASKTPLRDRRIGRPFLWSPTEHERHALQKDWEQLADMIARGDVAQITGHLGEVLQVRPKAASGRSRRRAPDEEGAIQWTMPRGFYLRPSFTARVLAALRQDA